MEESKVLECIVPRKMTLKEKQAPILFLGAAVMFLISGLMGMLLNMIFAVIFGIIGWFKYQKRSAEYEYTLIDGELNVDVIYNKKRRKKLLHGRLANVVDLVRQNDGQEEHLQERNMKLQDFSSRNPEDEHWILVFKPEEQYMGFVLTPDEEMLKEIRRRLRREGIVC